MFKDDAYWERRRKNNEAAKRSRDTRRQKEEEIAVRAALLEQENLKLRAQVALLKNETTKLHYMLLSQMQTPSWSWLVLILILTSFDPWSWLQIWSWLRRDPDFKSDPDLSWSQLDLFWSCLDLKKYFSIFFGIWKFFHFFTGEKVVFSSKKNVKSIFFF